MTEESRAAIPGWYGKIPSLGDFAARRLPVEFVKAWDTWLQDVIPAARAMVGDAWLDAYLTMPIWRFVLLPGLVGQSGWAGVLMPSVDRVGRHFPLAVAVELSSLGAAAHAVFDGGTWFTSLEDAALGVLDPTCGPDDLDATLAQNVLTAPPTTAGAPSIRPLQALPSVDAFGPLAEADALRAWSESTGWRTLWWTRGRVDGHSLMLGCTALPTADEFVRLLEGRPTSI
ncbi:MAG TPA: type VI secretion system-associated protein TagF [Methylomirabilota bacterium]